MFYLHRNWFISDGVKWEGGGGDSVMFYFHINWFVSDEVKGEGVWGGWLSDVLPPQKLVY